MDIGSMVRVKKGFECDGIKVSDWGIIQNFTTTGIKGEKQYLANVHFANLDCGPRDVVFDIYKICSGKPKRGFGLLKKICRQCNDSFDTTSSISVVCPKCRQQYYKNLRHRQYEKKVHVPSRVEKARNRYFINEQPCSSCGFTLLTKKRKFFNKESEKMEEFYLCPLCLALVYCGYKEPITWKPIDILPGNDTTVDLAK
jgi:hypothetical protein